VGLGHAKNLIPQLVTVGLIGEDGKPTELAMDWRDDTTYPAACQKILESIYPQGIRDALPPPNPDRNAVEQWFMRNAKVGEGAAGKMATFYLLLSASDVGQADGARKREAKPKNATAKAVPARSARSGTPAQSVGDAVKTTASAAESDAGKARGPSVHVDVQVHISPDASAEQIDQIFASMAKHLYGRRQ
jgi:hypothetical protein